MSSNSQNFSSSASFSYSSYSSSSTSDGRSSGHSQVHQSYTDPSGNTTVQSSTQNLGEPAVHMTQNFDAQGRELLGNGSSGAASRRIEDVSDDAQAQRDREYEERMEDEYAKREGGA